MHPSCLRRRASAARPIPFVLALLGLAGFTPRVSPAQQFSDAGGFELEWAGGDEPLTGPESEVREELMASPLELIVERINDEISLSERVGITFYGDTTGQPPAMYVGSEERHASQVYITYGFAVELRDKYFPDDPEGWFASLAQIVLHEMGHALVDVNAIEGIPKDYSEVVADELAFFVMSEFYDADDSLRKVADHLRRRPNSALNAETEHFPNEVRAEDYLCWVDGKLDWLDGESGRCASEYEALVDEWEERLAPWWKEAFPFELESE